MKGTEQGSEGKGMSPQHLLLSSPPLLCTLPPSPPPHLIDAGQIPEVEDVVEAGGCGGQLVADEVVQLQGHVGQLLPEYCLDLLGGQLHQVTGQDGLQYIGVNGVNKVGRAQEGAGEWRILGGRGREKQRILRNKGFGATLSTS